MPQQPQAGGTGTNLVIDTACRPRVAPSRPTLTIQRRGNGVLVSWPEQITGYRLQAKNDLSTTNWIDVELVNGQFTEIPLAPTRWYRLISP